MCEAWVYIIFGKCKSLGQKMGRKMSVAAPSRDTEVDVCMGFRDEE